MILSLSALEANEDNDTSINTTTEHVINKNTTTNNKDIKSDANQIIYANSNGNRSSDGSNRDNPTILGNALTNIRNDGTIILTSSRLSDNYASLSISIANAKNAKRFNMTADTGKSIYFGSITIPNGYNITLNNITFNKLTSYVQNNGNLTLNNCNFTNNNYNKSTGISTIIYNKKANLNIKSSLFNNNSANLSGVIYSESQGNVSVINSTFTDNHAYHGGAITSYESSLTITNSSFINNTASVGGAVCSLGTGKLYVTDTIFERNYASDYGGAIANWYSNITLIQSNITNNSAENFGGAISIFNASKSSLYENRMINNYASTANIIYCIKSTLAMNDNIIYNDKVDNWYKLENMARINIGSNWWGNNSPSFEVIGDGIIPVNWLYFKMTYQADNVIVSALLNDNITPSLPPINVRFYSNNGIFSYKSLNVANPAYNHYEGLIDEAYAVVDRQVLHLNEKINPSITVNNIICNLYDKINIIVKSNGVFNGDVIVKLNDNTLKEGKITNGLLNFTYTVKNLDEGSVNNISVIFNGNDLYNPKTVNSSLRIRYDYDNITNTVIPLYEYNQTVFVKNNLPTKYDSRDYDYVTSVKNQKSSGCCWAFSTIATLETVNKKYNNIIYDFSENNLKNERKKYSFTGETTSDPNEGNGMLEPVAGLVGWYNPVYEYSDNYYEYSLLSPANDSVYHVQDVYVFEPKSRSEYINEIKTAVYNQGAVTITYCSSGQGSNAYNSVQRSIDHAVSIIGWNDNYSKNNFANNGAVPKNNGAFIVKNSWGSNWGYGGYLYLSYDDLSLANSSNRPFTFLLDNNEKYSNIYQYDSLASHEQTTNKEIWLKNNYIAKEDNEVISAVGTYILSPSNYTVNIYVNNKLKHTQKGIIEIPGYKTIGLTSQIPINKDDLFSAEICFKATNDNQTRYLVHDSSHSINDIDYNQSLYKLSENATYLDFHKSGRIGTLKVYTKKYSKINTNITVVDNTLYGNTSIYLYDDEGSITYHIKAENSSQEISFANNENITNVTSDTNTTFTLNLENYTSGNYIVTVRYTSKNKLYMIEENLTFTIRKDTKLSLSYNTTQYIGNLSLDVNVTTLNDNNINTGHVSLYYNDILLAREYVTNSTAHFMIGYALSGNNTFNLKYDGLNRYDNASTTFNINLIKQDTDISISSAEDAYYNSEIIIKGRLNTKDNPLSSQNIILYVNNEYINTTKTNADGYFQFNIKIDKLGTSHINVSYDGNYMYIASTNTTQINIKKYESRIILDDIDDTVVYSNVTIKGRIITEASQNLIYLDVNNERFKAYADENNDFSFTYYCNNSQVNNITAYYMGNESHEATSSSLSFNVTKIESSIDIDKIDSCHVNDEIIIRGQVKNEAINISYANISLKINSNTYLLTSDDNGLFNISLVLNTSGQNILSIDYNGDNNNYNTTITVNVTVNKYNTTITANLPQTNIIGYNTQINGVLKSSDNRTLKNEEIQVNDNKIKTDNNGKYSANITFNKTGNNIIKVTYNGSPIYNQTSTTAIINIIKDNITIKPLEIKPTTINTNINITGLLLNSLNKTLTNKSVIINVNNKNYTTVTDNKGTYKLTYKTTDYGLNNITINYPGDDTTNKQTIKQNYTCRYPTEIEINCTSRKINQNMNITIKLTNKETQKSLSKKNVTIRINNNTLNKITDNNGQINIDYIPYSNNTIKIEAVFKQTDEYLNSSKTIEVQIEKYAATLRISQINTTNKINIITEDENNRKISQDGLITIKENNKTLINTNNTNITLNLTRGTHNLEVTYKNSTLYNDKTINYTIRIQDTTNITLNLDDKYLINNPIIIQGRLTSNNNPVGSVNIKIVLKNQNITVKSHSDGKYSYTYTPTSAENMTIKVLFEGNDEYLQTNVTKNMKIDKIDTRIKIEVKTDKTSMIKVTLTDNKNRTLSNQIIKIQVNNKTYTQKTDSNGQIILNTTLSPGTYPIKATYNTTNTYKESENMTTTTITYNTSITLDPIQKTYIGKQLLITGHLMDEKKNLLDKQKVTYTINNKTHTTLTDNGKIEIKYIPEEENSYLTIAYDGNRNYNKSETKASIKAYKINTTILITYNTTKIRINDNITVKIQLKDIEGKLSKENLSITINNKTYTRQTDNNGLVTLNVKVSSFDTKINTTVSYAGSSKYLSSKSSHLLNRTYQADMELLTGSFDTKPGDIVKLIAHLEDNGVDINEGQLVFKLNGLTLKDSKENPIKVNIRNGLAILEYKIPDTLSARTHNLTAVFASDNYMRTETSTPMTINKYATHINLNPVIMTDNHVEIKAQVVDQNNQALNKKTPVCIKINGRSYNLNTTTGTISYKITQNLKNGYYNITVISGENGKYLGCEAYNILIKSDANIKTAYINNSLNTNTNNRSGDIKESKIMSILTGLSIVKPGDRLKLIAHLSEDGVNINEGQLVFKLNGLTLKDSKKNPIKVNIRNGLAILEYKIPDTLSARTHNLTAVYSSAKYGRVELSTDLTMNRLNTHIDVNPIYADGDDVYIKASILDDNNNLINKQTAVSIKIDGKSYNMNNSNGLINFKVPVKLSDSYHQINIISGDNGKYYSSRANTILIKT